MVLKTTVDAAKNWSGALNRLGFGFLAIILIDRLVLVNFDLSFKLGDFEAVNVDIFAGIVAVFFLSLALGSVVLTFGSFVRIDKFSEKAKANRACRIGKSGNSLLVEMLREGTNKFEQAAGFFGLLLLFIVVVLGQVIWGYFMNPDEAAASIASNSGGASGVLGAIGAICGTLILSSATNTIDALDEVLDENYPLETRIEVARKGKGE